MLDMLLDVYLSSYCNCQILYDADNKVIGIGTNDMGIAKDGSKKENFQRGVELRGRSLSLSLSLINRYIFLINYIITVST